MKKPENYKEMSRKRVLELIEEFCGSEHDRKQQAFADMCGVSKSSISQYVNGTNAPGNVSAAKIANRCNVNPLWVMGFDVDRMSDADRFGKFANYINAKNVPDSIAPTTTDTYPLLGEVACGEPIIANPEYEVHSDGRRINADAVVEAKGDSMIGARIFDGDVVFIKYADTVENGQIAAVLVENMQSYDAEVVLKRFYRYGNNLIVLRSENPAYPDIEIHKEDHRRVKVIGKAIAFQSELR